MAPSDAVTAEEAKKVLLSLAESVAARLRKAGQLAGTVAVELKYADFSKASHQAPFLSPCNDTASIYQLSCSLFDQLWNGQPIRLLGIRSSRLTAEGEPVQLSIFDLPLNATPKPAFLAPAGAKKEGEPFRSPSPEKLKKLDAAMDAIRQKYGKNAIHKGQSTDFSGR